MIKGILFKKLYSVKFDHKLAFDQNVTSFFKKAKARLEALARVVPCIVLAEKNNLINSFFAAYFNYCPLIWIILKALVTTKLNI